MIDLLRSKLARDMDVAPLRDAYPAGDEFILVYDVLGRVIPPGGIPLAVGAVVMNVETAMNVAHAADHPVTEKYLTIAGAVAEPVTLRVPVGVTLGPVRGCRRRADHPGRQLHRRRRVPAQGFQGLAVAPDEVPYQAHQGEVAHDGGNGHKIKVKGARPDHEEGEDHGRHDEEQEDQDLKQLPGLAEGRYGPGGISGIHL